MKNTVFILIFLAFLGCKEKTTTQKDVIIAEEIAQSEKTTSEADTWEILFDGTSLDHWKGYLTEDVSAHWKIEGDVLVLYPPKERKNGESYNLVTKKDYTNFVLHLESNIAEGGNSGVFWGVKEDPKFGQPYQTGPEIQILDNERHPDAKAGTTHQAGALYDMVAPSENVARPAGEWNTMQITINHDSNQGSVVLNGTEVVTFPVNGAPWAAMVSKSKFADWEAFGIYATGKIGLQDHGDKVSFRNIKIRPL
ncbi:DUF1080 domain-containing protein [Arenibacter sp. GZD96]|uniref:3-keto-disaccharide hydrolase n=1 Tax=Aurantibrevibacter litoralis TaxID=3106030 RepID=UPI002AFED31F|nr:DUF1080 domain-containing protein [Arenibacter sp. GZD-96]MEA1787610.1 DUF1080 domain-containing protein [Arenibacter sp. GZD-96]